MHKKCPYLEFVWSVFSRIPSVRIQFECGKIKTRKTPNTAIFYAVPAAVCFFFINSKIFGINRFRTKVNIYCAKIDMDQITLKRYCAEVITQEN